MPVLEAAGGYLVLGKYRGPKIPRREWEDLTYTTYATDPATFFAPITSATGKIELKGFREYGKADLEGVWTENARKCPTLVRWIESAGTRFGRVQLLRMSSNILRECRWGLHLDNNNQGNPESNGWIVRVWMELTDDPASVLPMGQPAPPGRWQRAGPGTRPGARRTDVREPAQRRPLTATEDRSIRPRTFPHTVWRDGARTFVLCRWTAASSRSTASA